MKKIKLIKMDNMGCFKDEGELEYDPTVELTLQGGMEGSDPMETQRIIEVIERLRGEVDALLDHVSNVFVGGASIKRRLNELACFVVLNQIRAEYGITSQAAAGHMAFVGRSGTGKTKIAEMLGYFLYRLGYLEEGHLVKVTRHDLVGQYVGHTAPRTKEAINSAMKGVLYIKNAHNIYRPGNERDYGAEAIDIILQMMELRRYEFVLVFSGPKDQMGTLYSSNPGLSSRITHHIEFEDFTGAELMELSSRYVEDNLLILGPSVRDKVEKFLASSKKLRRMRPLAKYSRTLARKASRVKSKLGGKIESLMERLNPGEAESKIESTRNEPTFELKEMNSDKAFPLKEMMKFKKY